MKLTHDQVAECWRRATNETYADYFCTLTDELNKELARMVGEAPRVYGNPQIPNSWGLFGLGGCRPGKSDTHQARLVCIEPIGKESGE